MAKTLTFLMLGLLVAGGPLFAGAEGETPAAGEMAATGPEEPQYGGTLNVMQRIIQTDGTGDPTSVSVPSETRVATLIGEKPWTGGVEEFGPRGTNEYPFDGEFPPNKYYVGRMVESWEQTPDRLTFHLREGVMWSGMSPNPVMEARAYTAEDFVFNMERFLDSARGAGVRAKDWVVGFEIVSDRTVVLHTNHVVPVERARSTGTTWSVPAPSPLKSTRPVPTSACSAIRCTGARPPSTARSISCRSSTTW